MHKYCLLPFLTHSILSIWLFIHLLPYLNLSIMPIQYILTYLSSEIVWEIELILLCEISSHLSLPWSFLIIVTHKKINLTSFKMEELQIFYYKRTKILGLLFYMWSAILTLTKSVYIEWWLFFLLCMNHRILPV